MDNPHDKIALVTGANKGLGLEVARQLAVSSCQVFLGARNSGLGQAAAATLAGEGVQVVPLPLDLTNPATIRAAADRIDKEYGRLDILVNNAGINQQGDGLPSTADLAAIEQTLRVNFLGTLAVTQAMLPLLRKALSARVVNVSSGLGSLAQNGDPDYLYAEYKYLGYSASKAAINMLTVQLAYELRDTAIRVHASDPGFTATDLNGHRGTQSIPEGAAETIRLALLSGEGPTGTFSDRYGVVPW